MLSRALLSSMILLFGWHGHSHAATYTWVDAQGAVHYGQAPPGGVAARRVEPPAHTGSPSTGEDLRRRMEKMEERQDVHKAHAAQRMERERQAEARARNCSAARQNLRRLEGRGRIKTQLADGYRYLTDQEHGDAIHRARTQITEHCGPADHALP